MTVQACRNCAKPFRNDDVDDTLFGTLNHLHPRVGDAQPLTGCSATTGKRQRPHHQRGLAQEAPHPVTKSSARVGGVGVTRQAGIRPFPEGSWAQLSPSKRLQGYADTIL